MSKGVLSKVMKYELRYLDGCGDFRDMQAKLWDIQRQIQQILNRTIQISYNWDSRSRENYQKNGAYLNVLEETGYKRLDGYIYNLLKDSYTMIASTNLNAAIQKAWKKYANSKADIFSGKMSLPSYRSNQPIVLNKGSIRLLRQEDDICIEVSAFSKAYQNQQGASLKPRFIIIAKDNTQKNILDNILSGTYGFGECQLIYDKKKWFLLLTYNFVPQQHALDPNKILGVDLGECVAIFASVYNEYGWLRIEGGEVTQFARKQEAKIRSLQRQAPFCGEGRIGHGTKARVSNVYQAKDKVAQFRNTINHRYSKALIDFAIKKQCGVIQMEDLSGVKEDTGNPKFLRHWTYYDLQAKIEAKAKEHGIVVRKINPQYTSQRCSRCGYIDSRNRKTQADFCCLKCGFTANADYNASQNIGIANIQEIIKQTKSANIE